MSTPVHPTLTRLEDQIDWYDRNSSSNQRWFKRLKFGVLGAAALAPLSAGLSAPAWVPGGLGALVVFLEGIQQLNQYQQLWTTYRSTAESLKHEKYLYLAHAAPYNGEGDPLTLLAERVEGLVSQEHARWISTREQDKSGSKIS